MQTELVLGVTLGVDLTEPRLKKGYDMRIATGESHEEIIEGLSVMLTRLVEELFREEFNEDGMTTRVERL